MSVPRMAGPPPITVETAQILTTWSPNNTLQCSCCSNSSSSKVYIVTQSTQMGIFVGEVMEGQDKLS